MASSRTINAELAPRQATDPVTDAGAFVARMIPEIARALPKHMNPDRMGRLWLTEFRRTPLLARCTPESLGGAIMTCSQLGVEPGAAGEAYLLPFRNGKTGQYEVTFILGYQGMIKLFWQHPLAKSIDAQAVHANDTFDFAYGLEPRLEHRPTMGERGPVVCYYAVATLTSGGSAFVVMSPADVDAIRRRSKAATSGPWVSDLDAMARKTCVRQLFKLLPKSATLAVAMASDETTRTDADPDSLGLLLEHDEPVVEAEVVEDDPEVDPDTGEVIPADLFDDGAA